MSDKAGPSDDKPRTCEYVYERGDRKCINVCVKGDTLCRKHRDYIKQRIKSRKGKESIPNDTESLISIHEVEHMETQSVHSLESCHDENEASLETFVNNCIDRYMARISNFNNMVQSPKKKVRIQEWIFPLS